jgi:hypothetical protein
MALRGLLGDAYLVLLVLVQVLALVVVLVLVLILHPQRQGMARLACQFALYKYFAGIENHAKRMILRG